MKERECDILRDIRIALSQVPGCDVQRCHQVMSRIGGRVVRGGLDVGAPDLICCVRGRYVALEVKTRKGRLSEEQVAWHDRMRAVGAIVAVVRSVEDALAVVGSVAP